MKKQNYKNTLRVLVSLPIPKELELLAVTVSDMGSLIGHVLAGMAFFMLGFWHLFNHVKLHSLQPNSHTSSPWFLITKPGYLVLYLIMLGSSIFILMELFIGPAKHHPFDVDGTIPSPKL
uniref:Uncharacterized protein n=1 Tax=Salix viminalis TaxID=40686 RepID=A0A6N2LNC0_SALVM